MNRPHLARLAVSLSLLMAWATLGRVSQVAGTPHPRGLSALVDLSALTKPAFMAAATVVFLIALGAFAIGRKAELAGLSMAAMLALGGHVQVSQWPVDHGANRALVLPGAAILAYALALIWSRWRKLDDCDAERVGINAACGIAAATYFLAGLSKLSASGIAWVSGGNLSLHILVHSQAGQPWLLPLRTAIANIPWLCTAFGVGTLLIECSFLLFVLPQCRRFLALGALSLHLGIALALGLHHYDWMFMTLGLGFYPAAQRLTSG